MPPTSNVADKVVVITGASSGLGESTARLLAAQGAKVVLGARRAERLETVAREIESAGGTAIAMSTDVTRRADLQALVRKAVERFDRLDVLVNNAGTGLFASLALLKVEEWDRMIDVNLKGVLYGIAAALPQMMKQQSGHIINLASLMGIKVSAPAGTVYSATKAAVRALSEGLRVEMHAHNIRTTMISPGAVSSEILEGISDAATAAAMKRTWDTAALQPGAVARAILYAIEQPVDVDVNEIVLRPVGQGF